MPLPPYSSHVTWKEYNIETPTFSLTPVEKPDMSPFLFHMTGRNQLHSIISSKDVDSQDEHGFLKTCIPEATNEKYNAEVVCFTESPTFALDFFRYRSFSRWKNDQRFGIGFDKSKLVSLGVRPCVYADDGLKNDIIYLKNNIESNLIQDVTLKERIKSLIASIYPLTTPLLENRSSQGFMWEREWRYSNSLKTGLSFHHNTIKLICCPADEESEIKQMLGGHSKNIQFIRSWTEYNEVTAYLKRRKNETHIPIKDMYKDESDFLSGLKEQLKLHQITLNSIVAYQEFIDSVGSKQGDVGTGINEITKNIEEMLRQIKSLEQKT